jgi:hypothetical protein
VRLMMVAGPPVVRSGQGGWCHRTPTQ